MIARFRAFTVAWVLLAVIFMLAQGVYGESIPQLINYNGTLTDAVGNPVPDGNVDVTFKIYDSATTGNLLWTETWNSTTSQVIVIGGNFNAMLGAHTPFPASFFADHPVTYLGITVGADSEMLPRQRITSVGYAFNAGNGVPKGGIIMWSGAADQIPEGWALCDGANDTPDLRDRFIVGAGVVGVGSNYSVGEKGGEAKHTLTTNEMPSHTHIQNSHTHGVNDPGHKHTFTLADAGGSTRAHANGPDNAGTATTSTNITGITIQAATAVNQNTGGGAAHENRPPYYALCFIMKL